MSLEIHLKNLGLSDKEAKVYLSMLEIGKGTVLEISAKAGVNRPTTYVQIESLKKRGLVSTHTEGKKQYFTAESPEQLEVILNTEKKLIEQREDELAKVLPELRGLFASAGERPQVRFLEGVEGLLVLQEMFLKTKSSEIWGISNLDKVMNVFPKHSSNYTPRRLEKNIRSKIIYTSSRGDFLKEKDTELHRESKFVPEDKFSFSADISIFDDKVAIAALEGKVSGVLIEHKGIADSFRGLFRLLWES